MKTAVNQLFGRRKSPILSAMHARVLEGRCLPFEGGVAVPRIHAGDLEMT
jgi:hypothetical protein